VASKIVQDSVVAPFGLLAMDPLPGQCVHAQEALIAAQASSQNAFFTALVMNRVDKMARGAALGGAYGDTAQDALRAGLLFAGAGLDQALKRLVDFALSDLVGADDLAKEKFEQWAQRAMTHPDTGGVDPRQLVQLLLGTGATPRAVLVDRYAQALTGSSAQSVERVEEIATALGVKDASIRKRCKSGSPTPLKSAFGVRNQISHELDLTEAPAVSRARFERRRRSRTFASMWDHANECLQVTQLIINNVGERLAPAT
jgi:hypothetical protein